MAVGKRAVLIAIMPTMHCSSNNTLFLSQTFVYPQARTHTHNKYTPLLMPYCNIQTRDSSTTHYRSCHSTYSTGLYIINYLKHCVSYTVFQTNDTDFTQQVGVVNKQFRLQRIVCVGWWEFVFVFYRTKHLKHCVRPGAEGDIWSEVRGSSRWWTKLYSGELHDLYRWLNVGGEWTERQWDRWDKRNVLEKLKIHTKIQLENLRGTAILGDLGLDEMLQCNEPDVKDYNSSSLPLSKTKILPSLYQFC
jgi:hypothetical protein